MAPMPRPAVLLAAKLIGLFKKDVLLTRDEIDGLSAGLLVSTAPVTCPTRFSEWVDEHGDALGRRYASELARHWRQPDLRMAGERAKRPCALL